MLALIDSPYAKTPDAIYSVYFHVHDAVPGARYGGAYVLKAGFHSSVDDNLEHWPDNYSIREAINRQPPRNVTRALDITLSDADMLTLTGRLAAAAKASDPRLEGLREFFGTMDGDTVYGRSRLGPTTAWYVSSADSSHLWHIHLSYFTPYAYDWAVLSGIVSVLSGESLDDYLGRNMERNLAEYGDSGSWIGFFQRCLKDAGATITVDNRYGDQTTAALKWWWTNVAKGTTAYDGRSVTSWVGRELIRRDSQPTQAQVDAAVATWLAANPPKIPTGVRVSLGTVNGTLTGG